MKLRGADVVARSLERAGVRYVFTLSGNHVMPVPTRYDQVAAAFGAHGEHVARRAELAPAMERAAGAGRTACVNVLIEPAPAPAYRRRAP